MYQPVQFQSGDLVRLPNQVYPGYTEYGILFYLNEKPFLLLPDGSIREGVPVESLEWVCHTALVHGSYFRSLEQVQSDFASGAFDHVIGSVPRSTPKPITVTKSSTHFKNPVA